MKTDLKRKFEFNTLRHAFARLGVHIVEAVETKETCSEPCYEGPFPRHGYNVKVDGVHHAVYVLYQDEGLALRCALNQLSLNFE